MALPLKQRPHAFSAEIVHAAALLREPLRLRRGSVDALRVEHGGVLRQWAVGDHDLGLCCAHEVSFFLSAASQDLQAPRVFWVRLVAHLHG